MKRTLTILIPVLLIVGSVFWWKSAHSAKASAPYRLGVVDRGQVQMAVTATGTASAVTTVTVGSQVSGTIKEILVDFNSQVHKGQVLARLDPTFLQASVSEADANLEKAQASENQAERDYARAQELAAKNLVAQVELDNALTSLETAKASVRQAESALKRARVNLQYSIITSPIDGVVVSRNVDVGQTVAASLQAPTLFTIAQDLRQMQIETQIDEADIGQLQDSMKATFTVDSYPEETFHARVDQIRYAAKDEQGVVTYPVILKVDNPDLKLRPGMTANVTIVTARRENVLRMQAAALRFKPADYKPERGGNGGGGTDSTRMGRRGSATGDSTRWRGRHRGGDSTSVSGGDSVRSKPPVTVFTKGLAGKADPRKVSIGLNDGTNVEITGGDLAQGDSVIVGLAGTKTAATTTMPPGMGGGPGRR
jgi:HlyD family secretion protein